MKNWLASDVKFREQIKKALVVTVIVTLAVIFVPSSYTGGMVGINDLRNEQERQQRRLESLLRELADNQAVLAMEDSLIRERSELAPMIAYYESRLPSTVETPELLRELDLIANRSGQIFTKHDRETPVETGAIVELPYKIEMHSDYHGFGRFLNAIENAERFAKVDNISIKFDKDDYIRHDVSLTLSTFIFNQEKLKVNDASATKVANASRN